MLALTGDFEKSAGMSGIPSRTLRRWAADAAAPRRRTCGAKFEPYGDEVGRAVEMARKGASCRTSRNRSASEAPMLYAIG